MPSRLAQLRTNRQIIIGCLGLSAIVLGSLAIQRMSQAQDDRRAAQRQQSLQQQQEAERLAGLTEAHRRAAIEANAQGWRQWQAHIGSRCNAVISRLENRSYLGASLGKGRLVYEGLIICDRDYVAILKGPQLVPMWTVPRPGSRYPLPQGLPPPEFRPIPSSQPINPTPTEHHGQEKLLQNQSPIEPSDWQ